MLPWRQRMRSKMKCYSFGFIVLALVVSAFGQISEEKFPEDFLFGAATSAYQVEGGWKEGGKGENIWDRYTHHHPEQILDKSNGDTACDSYHKYQEDVALLKNLGVNFYRFSLSWSRILPTGFRYKINPDGIRYYNHLINELLRNEIQPMVTMFHWDTPQPIEDLGGFTNDLFPEWFEEYAGIVFENFGDRVKLWITFNEPRQICLEGYGGNNKAPGYNSSGIGDYICGHNLLKAHARAYHLYDEKFRHAQNGRYLVKQCPKYLFYGTLSMPIFTKDNPPTLRRHQLIQGKRNISITTDTGWMEPNTQDQTDLEAAERAMAFWFGWFTDPIFHKNGDYPSVMQKFIKDRSLSEGFTKSRLPKFTPAEIDYIRGTYDFFGLNHYSSVMVKDAQDEPIGQPSVLKDFRARLWYDKSWPKSASSWIRVVPWGFRKLLIWIKKRYGDDLEIYITENGYSDHGELEDLDRINYYQLYLSALLDAMKEGVKVKAYTAWSLLDNMEWKEGYTAKLGLYHVDFEDPSRKRTPKASVAFYKSVIANRTLV